LVGLCPAQAQVVSQRGFIESRGTLFPQDTPRDPTQATVDLLVREEVFARPAPWLRLAGGLDLRAYSHDQVDDRWSVDWADRGTLRPRVALRRASATVVRGPLTVDLGKQFIRWGTTDVINPTDRFAPRDFLNVIDTEYLAVTGARAVVQATEHDTIEGVWVPRLTPSRVPLLTQRWTTVPADVSELPLIDAGVTLPHGTQAGVRWSHVGTIVGYSLSFFDGFNHLPDIDAKVGRASDGSVAAIDVARVYPAVRSYGAEATRPFAWFSVKGEAAFVTSTSATSDEYLLYVVQIERQTGEWVFIGGYAGEAVTNRRAALTFDPD